MNNNTVLTHAIDRLADGEDLAADEASRVLREVMEGNASEAETAGLLVALRTKGETVHEIAGLAATMRSLALRVDAGDDLVDTAGTGGGRPTFNVSTTAAFVAAGAGCRVAKHGNRSATSQCGSADVIEALGARIDLEPEEVAHCIDAVGFGFMFAPKHHAAMRYVVPVRRALGVRTIFNFLGPLTNPAGARRQVIGVSDRSRLEMMAAALGELGTDRALVVSSADGLDEFSVSGATRVVELREGELATYEVTPEEVGLERAADGAVGAGTPDANARVLRRVLEGEPGTERSLALLNAAAAVYVSGRAESIREGVESAARIDRLRRRAVHAREISGAVAMSIRLDELVGATREAVHRRKRERPLAEVEREAGAQPEGRPFAEALSRPGTSLIAEHKRRSPSAGTIREGASCAELVQAYERGGAAAVSVLTEEAHFGGSLADLREARAAIHLPILRKDFTIDRYQLYEAKAAGADAILLVVGSMEPAELGALLNEAWGLDLDAIVEVATEEELATALEWDVDVLGINNRNLEDFSVDLERTFDLLHDVPTGKVVVSESGIHTREQIEGLEEVGVDAVLIGEMLMRAPDPEAAVRELAGAEEPTQA